MSLKNYKKPISALTKMLSLIFMNQIDQFVYSGLTVAFNKVIGEPKYETQYIDEANRSTTGQKEVEIQPFLTEHKAGVYQTLQSTGMNILFNLFTVGDQVLFSSLLASLGVNTFIATMANFSGYNRSISELLKFSICAGVNTGMLGGIDLALEHFIEDPITE